MAEFMGACVYCGQAQLVVAGEGIRATLTAKENSIKVERVEIEKSALED